MAQIETQLAAAANPGIGSVTGRPLWLNLDRGPVYAVLHDAPGPGPVSAAALIMPTFGWDNDWSYRPRRAWATALAERGVMTLRFDFPGTEDSVGSPVEPDQVQSWIDATVSVAGWLRDRSGCARLTVVGAGLGGQIAYEAVAAGAAIDDLVLWGVRESGRAYMRELRTFAGVLEAPADAERDQARADGLIGIGGHRMSPVTAERLAEIRLADTPLPSAQLRRVLLIGRDAHGVDKKLKQHLEQSGADLSVIDADDYRSLVARAELQLIPRATIAASIEWMLDPAAGQLEAVQHDPLPTVPEAVDSVTFDYNGVRIRESLTEAMTGAGRVQGIISEPLCAERDPYCLVLTNAGTLRRTGPGRVSVEIARRAAAGGTPAARFDLPGLGDSDGEVTKTFERTPADDAAALAVISEIYDHLERDGIAARFAPGGLCLAGYFAQLMLSHDARSIGAIVINAPTLSWGEEQRRAMLRTLGAEMGPQAVAIGQPERPRVPSALLERWHRLGRLRYAAENRARSRLASIAFLWRSTHRDEVAAASRALDELGRVDLPVFFELSEGEPLVHVFAHPKLERRLRRFPNIKVERLGTNDHDLRPLWSQDVALERVSGILRELGSQVKP